MFHLKVKPSPPSFAGLVTPGHAVDSSAIVTQPGASAWTVSLSCLKKSIASRFSRPPCLLRSQDRKSTRLNSSHANISYAVFCLKKKHQSRYDFACHHLSG